MNTPWAICLARDDASSLAALRLFNGVEVGEQAGILWLRGKAADERLASLLAGLPARERYEWQPSGRLRLQGRRIPAGRCPDLQWQPLQSWLCVELPASALPATAPAGVALRLVRSTNEREPDLLLTTVDELTRFVATAAQARLARLEYAVDAGGQSFVRGRPLPPLPGRRFVTHGSVAVPAGFRWQPAVGADVLARRFAVSGDALVVWHEDGTVSRLHGEQFVALTRGGLRFTQKALAGVT